MLKHINQIICIIFLFFYTNVIVANAADMTIKDLIMGEKENFPGVSEDILISMWSKISPDPNLILGITNSFFTN